MREFSLVITDEEMIEYGPFNIPTTHGFTTSEYDAFFRITTFYFTNKRDKKALEQIIKAKKENL